MLEHMITMTNIDLVGAIMKMRADNQSDDEIKAKIQGKGMDTSFLQEAFEALESDEVIVVHTLFYKTFLNPITYVIGVRKISVQRRIMEGLMKNNDEIGIRTIDKVNVEEDLISADVVIVHADQSEVRISNIAKSDAQLIQKFFGYVIETQRMRVVNVASD